MSEKTCNCNCAENRREQFKELQPVLDQYAKVPGSLITILQKAQEIYGYLSIDTINYISDATGIKPAKIYGVATFYAQFRLQPIGKYLIMLCQGTACHVNGSEMIEEAVCEYLGVTPEFVVINWDTKETELESKIVDCLWNGLTVDDERKENMDFSASYMNNKQVVVIQKKNADKYTDIESLKNCSVVAEQGSAGENAVADVLGIAVE